MDVPHNKKLNGHLVRWQKSLLQLNQFKHRCGQVRDWDKCDKFRGPAAPVQTPQRSDSRGDGGSRTARQRGAAGDGPAPAAAAPRSAAVGSSSGDVGGGHGFSSVEYPRNKRIFFY